MTGSEELKLIRQLVPQLFHYIRRVSKKGISKRWLKKDEKSQVESPVTTADIDLNELITRKINKHFPSDAILSEEAPDSLKMYRYIIQGKGMSGKRRSRILKKKLWIIDPICGSGNFASGINFFSTNIALFADGMPVFSAVVDYSKETYYWAAREISGVYEREEKVNPAYAIDNKKRIDIEDAFFFGRSKKMLKAYVCIVSDIIRSNMRVVKMDTSLSFAYTALAKYGGFLVFQVYPWDFAAHCFLVEKNGGVATDFKGNRWSLTSKDIVASLDRKIHHELLKIVKKHWF